MNYGNGNDNLLQKDLYQPDMPPRIAAVSIPDPAAGPLLTQSSAGDSQHSKAELAQFLVMATFPFPGLWCTQGSVCALQASLAGMRLNFKPNCDPHASFSVSSSLLLHVGYLFLVGSNILLSIAVQQPVVMLVLLQKMSIHPSTLPSLSQLCVT